MTTMYYKTCRVAWAWAPLGSTWQLLLGLGVVVFRSIGQWVFPWNRQGVEWSTRCVSMHLDILGTTRTSAPEVAFGNRQLVFKGSDTCLINRVFES